MTGFKTKSVLCLPVRLGAAGSQILAVLQVLNKSDGEAFNDGDIDMMQVSWVVVPTPTPHSPGYSIHQNPNLSRRSVRRSHLP
jgi:hypothetical protein